MDQDSGARLQRAVASFLPTPEQVSLALGATNRRMARWLRARALTELAPALGIPRKILNRRFKTYTIASQIRGGKLWLGLRGIPFTNLDPHQEGRGVITHVGQFYEENAFIQLSRRSGRAMVLKRRGKTWEGPHQRGKLDFVDVTIEQKALLWAQAAIRRTDFEAAYFKRLEHELRWRTTS